MKYYDKLDELKSRYLDKILKTSELEFKLEKRDFFKNHRYIFIVMNDLDAQCIRDLYGVDDDTFKPYAVIADELGCSTANIRRRVLQGMHAIDTHPYRDLLAEFTDEDLGFSEEKKDEFDRKRLNDFYDIIVERNQRKEESRISKLSVEDIKAETAFESLLRKKFFSTIPHCRMDVCTKRKLWDYTFGDILTTFSKEDFQDPNNLNLIQIMRALNLEFLNDYEYVKDWKNACIEGIKEYGVGELKNSFSLMTGNDAKMIALLNKSTDILNYNIKIKNILSHNGIKTITDLVSLKENEVYKMRQMGPDSLAEVVSRLSEKGLKLCPENLYDAEWIYRLLNGEYMQVNNDEIIDTLIQPKSTFDELLAKPVYDLEFPARAKSRFRYYHIDTVEDLVKHSKYDLYRIRYMGNQTFNDVFNVLAKYNLGLRPEDMDVSEWMEKLKESYTIAQNNENAKKMKYIDKAQIDLHTIPHDLRQYVCRGVGETIKDEISNSTYDILIHKAKRNYQTKIIPEADNPTFERVKYDCNDAENSLD